MQRFRTKLVGDGPGGAWVHLYPPVDVVVGFGSKGQIRVSGTINGVPFRSTLMPQEGAHRMAVTKELRAAAGVGAGSEVDVTMERDTAERTVDVPVELAAALAADAAARERFDRLAFSHRKEYADWIGSAKKPETRLERARKAVTMIAEGAPRR